MRSSVDYLDFDQLTDIDVQVWTRLQSADSSLASPYFSYAYFNAVNSVRPGIKVLRFHQRGQIAAYWPFRKGPFGTARPVAGTMDDLQGIIAHPKAILDFSQPAVRRSIGGYAFSAVPFSQRRHGLAGQ